MTNYPRYSTKNIEVALTDTPVVFVMGPRQVGEVPDSDTTRIRTYLMERLVTGCFPESLQRKTEERIQAWYKQYLNSLVQKDIKEIEHIDHPEKMFNLLKLTAFYSGKLINLTEFGGKLGLDRLTAKKYLGLLYPSETKIRISGVDICPSLNDTSLAIRACYYSLSIV